MRGPTAADLQSTFGRQVDTLAKRVKSYSAADWGATSANPDWTNADVIAHLVALLEAFCQGVELRAEPERPAFGDEAKRPADAALSLALSDVGERLEELLRGTQPTDLVWHPRYRFSARTMAALSLAEAVLHRWDVTGPGDRGPEPRAARLVLQGLFPSRDDSGASPVALLLHLTGRREIEGRPGWKGTEWRYELPDEIPGDRAS